MSTQAPVSWGSQSESEPSVYPVLVLERRLTCLNVFSQLKDNRNHLSDTILRASCRADKWSDTCTGVWYHGSPSHCPKLSLPSPVSISTTSKKLLPVLQWDYRREENTGVAILTDHSSLIQKMPVWTFHVLIIPRIFVSWYMNITVFCQGCPVIQSFEQRFVTEVCSKSACFFMEQS